MGATGYLLENTAAEAGGRFAGLSAIFDPVTVRHLDTLGVGPGWRCWEVGAGGPSIPRLLAERVGPAGSVLATDLDVAWLGEVGDAVEVRRHDVATDDPPQGFDLVHARLVLTHVPARTEALRRMAGALRTGGWLLVEDFDVRIQPWVCLDPRSPADDLANRIRAGFVELLTQRGVDMEFGRTLPRRLREAGLVDVAADAYFPVAHPGGALLEAANVRQVRDGLVARGHATDAEIDTYLTLVEAGRLDIASPPLVSARGRRDAAVVGPGSGSHPDAGPDVAPVENLV
jgi:SAM-dependent methyltransferase